MGTSQPLVSQTGINDLFLLSNYNSESTGSADTLGQSLHWLFHGRKRQSLPRYCLLPWHVCRGSASLRCLNHFFMTLVIYCTQRPPAGSIPFKSDSLLLNTCEPQHRLRSSPSFPVHQSRQQSSVITKQGQFWVSLRKQEKSSCHHVALLHCCENVALLSCDVILTL